MKLLDKSCIALVIAAVASAAQALNETPDHEKEGQGSGSSPMDMNKRGLPIDDEPPLTMEKKRPGMGQPGQVNDLFANKKKNNKKNNNMKRDMTQPGQGFDETAEEEAMNPDDEFIPTDFTSDLSDNMMPMDDIDPMMDQLSGVENDGNMKDMIGKRKLQFAEQQAVGKKTTESPLNPISETNGKVVNDFPPANETPDLGDDLNDEAMAGGFKIEAGLILLVGVAIL